MIKISKLYQSPNGTREPFSLEYDATDFEIPEIEGEISASGQLMRVEEGIMMLVESLEATQVTHCGRCGKRLKMPLPFEGTEWLFYDSKPDQDDDENEHLQLDMRHWELNPKEPIRQDLMLHKEAIPRCEKLCQEFKDGVEELKPLAGLKDLFKK